jgi:hypothetical protein
MAPTWKEIREAGEAADLDMEDWEDKLHDKLVAYIVNHTKTIERYHNDAEFHAQIERLVLLVIACISEHSPLTDDKLRARAAEFDDLFKMGASEGRPDAG